MLLYQYLYMQNIDVLLEFLSFKRTVCFLFVVYGALSISSTLIPSAQFKNILFRILVFEHVTCNMTLYPYESVISPYLSYKMLVVHNFTVILLHDKCGFPPPALFVHVVLPFLCSTSSFSLSFLGYFFRLLWFQLIWITDIVLH